MVPKYNFLCWVQGSQYCSNYSDINHSLHYTVIVVNESSRSDNNCIQLYNNYLCIPSCYEFSKKHNKQRVFLCIMQLFNHYICFALQLPYLWVIIYMKPLQFCYFFLNCIVIMQIVFCLFISKCSSVFFFLKHMFNGICF